MMGREYQQGLRSKSVEDEMEETYVELDSSPPRAQGHDYLSYESPLPPGPVPPLCPTTGGETI